MIADKDEQGIVDQIPFVVELPDTVYEIVGGAPSAEIAVRLVMGDITACHELFPHFEGDMRIRCHDGRQCERWGSIIVRRVQLFSKPLLEMWQHLVVRGTYTDVSKLLCK